MSSSTTASSKPAWGPLTLTSESGSGVFQSGRLRLGRSVQVTGGTLVVDGDLTDAFSNSASTSGQAIRARFNHGWELDSSGVLELDGGSGTPSTVGGTTSDIAGRVDVNGRTAGSTRR